MTMIRVLENEFYYLDNFQRVLDWIAERYADLLIDEEHAFIAAFPQLPQPARAQCGTDRQLFLARESARQQ